MLFIGPSVTGSSKRLQLKYFTSSFSFANSAMSIFSSMTCQTSQRFAHNVFMGIVQQIYQLSYCRKEIRLCKLFNITKITKMNKLPSNISVILYYKKENNCIIPICFLQNSILFSPKFLQNY